MTRLAGLIVLSALAIPANASHPTRARQEKPRPTQSAEPPLAVPLPIPPAPALPNLAENSGTRRITCGRPAASSIGSG